MLRKKRNSTFIQFSHYSIQPDIDCEKIASFKGNTGLRCRRRLSRLKAATTMMLSLWRTLLCRHRCNVKLSSSFVKAMDIKVIDFANCSIAQKEVSPADLEDTGKLIFESFSSIGFAYLSNTGIVDEDAAEIRNLAKQFFALDQETKNKYTLGDDNFGYIAPGVENLATNDPYKPGEYKEVFDITGGGPMAEKWVWPDPEVPGFSTKMSDFMEKIRQLAMGILDALAVGMDLKDKDYFTRCHSKANNVGNQTALRALYYPVIPDDYVARDGELRLGEHSDWGSISILFQDFVGGLEVQRNDGTYIEATPIPGTALVNIGDALEFWTKGRLKSTKHKIPMPDIHGKKNVERYSLVYFLMPDSDVLLSGIQYKDATHESVENDDANFKPITTLEHLQRKYSESNLPVPT